MNKEEALKNLTGSRIALYCIGLFASGAMFTLTIISLVNKSGSLMSYSFLVLAPLLGVVTGSIIFYSVNEIKKNA